MVASVLTALLMVRTFVLYHDYMHGSILRDSKLAAIAFHFYGILALTPASSWRQSHNFHHAHVGLVKASSIGSFPILTTESWSKATRWQRALYVVRRHPLAILAAYATVFLYSVCFESLLESPRKHWASAVALILHGAISAALWILAGPATMLFAFVLPHLMASAFGAYLFYSQHNFVGVKILHEDEWSYSAASLESSSYMRVGPLMRYFTANIGCHHVHHLNPMIPHYRLRDAMAAIPELRNPTVTSLRLRDVRDCLRLKLWDAASQRMLTYRQFRELERRVA
jgi:omega-6 fatty acid desaturase (delta-12 desaturase)